MRKNSVVLLNPLIAFVLLCFAVKYSAKLSGTIAAGLAQIGEFSIVLASTGVSLAVLPRESYNLLLGAVLISIVLHSLTFRLLQALSLKVEKSSFSQRLPSTDPQFKF